MSVWLKTSIATLAINLFVTLTVALNPASVVGATNSAVQKKAQSRTPQAMQSVPQDNYKGIVLAAVPPKAGKKFDTRLVGAKAALKRMKASLAVIHKSSPNSWKDIELLQSDGKVVFIYAPGYLEKGLGHNVAVYLPDFRAENESGGLSKYIKIDKSRVQLGGAYEKVYVSVVGRHGIKWSARELGVVMVHEYAGHGIQQYRSESGTLRSLDAECEAYIKTEQAYRDLKFKKLHDDRVYVRMAMERRFCIGFKNHLSNSNPKAWKVWNSRNFHVPTLLVAFQGYTRHLVQSGVIARTHKAIKKRQRKAHARARRKGEFTPKQAYQFAGKLWAGNLSIQKDRVEAVRWLNTAAKGGYAPALHFLGELHIIGDGVKADMMLAVKYLKAAALKGHVTSQFRLGKLYRDGLKIDGDLVEAYAWFCLAAANKHADAAETKFELSASMEPAGLSKGEARAKQYASKVQKP